jgi:hypothetical protein
MLLYVCVHRTLKKDGNGSYLIFSLSVCIVVCTGNNYVIINWMYKMQAMTNPIARRPVLEKFDQIYIRASKFSDKNTMCIIRGLVTFCIPKFGLVHFKMICQALQYVNSARTSLLLHCAEVSYLVSARCDTRHWTLQCTVTLNTVDWSVGDYHHITSYLSGTISALGLLMRRTLRHIKAVFCSETHYTLCQCGDSHGVL